MTANGSEPTSQPQGPDGPEGPRYEHDCTCCVFLGRYDEGDRPYDLYYHPDTGESRYWITIVARYSSEGANYMSGMCFGYTGRCRPLVEARRRAEAAGLDVCRDLYHQDNIPAPGEMILVNVEGVDEWSEFRGLWVTGLVYRPRHEPPSPLCTVPYEQVLDRVRDLDGEWIYWQLPINGI